MNELVKINLTLAEWLVNSSNYKKYMVSKLNLTIITKITTIKFNSFHYSFQESINNKYALLNYIRTYIYMYKSCK